MPTLNQDAPPAPIQKSTEFVKLDPFPTSDSYVLTLTAFNYIKDHPFERTSEEGVTSVKPADAVELYFGTHIDGKPYFLKTWPQAYSTNEKSNYFKYYKAMTGVVPSVASNVKDLLGLSALVAVDVKEKKSLKGTAYKVSQIVNLVGVPSMLKSTAIPLEVLKPALTEILNAKKD